MGLFSREKDIVELLQKENKKLKRENAYLSKKLSEIDEYKNQYEGLVKDLSECKKRYEKLINQADSIYGEYEKQLDKIVETK